MISFIAIWQREGWCVYCFVCPYLYIYLQKKKKERKKIISIYLAEFNEFKPCECAISRKKFFFVLFMVSRSYLYSVSYQGYAIQLLIDEFSFIMFLFTHVEGYKLSKLVRML